MLINKKKVANQSKDIDQKILALAPQNDKTHLMNVWVLFGAAKEEQKLERKEEDYSLPMKSESAFNSNILGI